MRKILLAIVPNAFAAKETPLPKRFQCSTPLLNSKDPKSGTQFWTNLIPYSEIASDSSASFLEPEQRQFIDLAVALTNTDENTNHAVESCVPGVLTIVLRAIPVVDYDMGRENAKNLFNLAEDVLLSLDDEEAKLLQGSFDSLLLDDNGKFCRDWNATYGCAHPKHKWIKTWRGELLLNAYQFYKFLFSDEPSFFRSMKGIHEEGTGKSKKQKSCNGPKFFVHDLSGGITRPESPTKHLKEHPELSLSPFFSNNGLVGCSFGMYGTEVLWERFFLNHECRTKNPDEANFFFVPSFFKCVEAVNWHEEFRNDGQEAVTMANEVMQLIKTFENGKFWRKNQGADHIFMFSWGRFPCAMKNWRNVFGVRSIFLQVEDQCHHLDKEVPEPTFSPWKDVIVPGHLDFWRVSEITKHKKKFEERDLLLVFHGRWGGMDDTYKNVPRTKKENLKKNHKNVFSKIQTLFF